MNNYQHPSFFIHIPSTTLFYCMMGQGSIYRIGKEFIMYTADYKCSLPCGCAGTKVVKIVDDQGNRIYQELTPSEAKVYAGKAEEHISFQGTGCENFWEILYKKHPSLKPITINNF
jgi:hypothetical protein